MPRYYLILRLLVVLSTTSQVYSQWNEVVRLTNDSLDHVCARAIVDDSFRLHVFYVRSVTAQSLQPMSLYYQRFDNWGNSISEAIEILPGVGQNRQDHVPCVFLDANQNIHVVWSRTNALPELPRIFYLRMDTSGNILTQPQGIAPVDWPNFWVDGGITATQTQQGEIWFGCNTHVIAVNEEGDVTVPMQPIHNPYYDAMGAILSVDADDHVWACVRYFNPELHQSIAIIRVDTVDIAPEIVATSQGPAIVQMTPEAFYIDPFGAFHYVLYREDTGLFYRRDPRDGSGLDTIVIDPTPFSEGVSLFSAAGGDTLLFVWGESMPQSGFWRVGFSLSGNIVLTPIFSDPNMSFSIATRHPVLWKSGSSWIVGATTGMLEGRHQVGMIHVPGPNEPPNAVDDRTSQSTNSTFILSPNPTTGPLRLHGSLEQVKEVAVFNILGQRVWRVVQEPGSAPLVLPHLSALPAGPYFVNIRTPRESYVQKIILQR